MTTYSDTFERALRYTVEKTLAYREPDIFVLDPEVSTELGEPPTKLREVLAEFGSVFSTKVFCGFIDEGGFTTSIKLYDGNVVNIQLAAHINIEKSEGNTHSMTRHLLDYSGVVYRSCGEEYEALDESQIESMLEELGKIG